MNKILIPVFTIGIIIIIWFCFSVRVFYPKSFHLQVGNQVFYNANNFMSGTELAILKGSGEAKIFDLYPGINSSSPREFVEFEGNVFFTANDPKNGFELWKHGIGLRSILFKDIFPGKNGSFPAYFTVCDDRVFFTADIPGKGRELAILDPRSGAIAFFDHEPGPYSSYPLRLTCFQNKLFYVVKDAPNNKGVYSLDKDLQRTLEYRFDGASPPDLIKVSDRVLLIKTTESLFRYESPGKISYKDYLTITNVPEEVVSAMYGIFRRPERKFCESGGLDKKGPVTFMSADEMFKFIFPDLYLKILKERQRIPKFCSHKNIHKFNYLFNIEERIFLQKAYSISILNLNTLEISLVENPSHLRLHEFYSFARVGEVYFTRARKRSNGKIIEVFIKNDKISEYVGPGSMYDLIYFNGEYFYRESILSAKLINVKL